MFFREFETLNTSDWLFLAGRRLIPEYFPWDRDAQAPIPPKVDT